MNVQRPHDIVSEKELRRMPAKQRDNYRPITRPAKEILDDMSEDQRAEWLARQPKLTDVDRLRIARALNKRIRKAARKVR